MQQVDNVRVDKWLWAVRLYKTRSQAIQACQGGHVKIRGQRIKPSRTLHLGETLTAFSNDIEKTVKVIGLIEQRIGAKMVAQYLEDLTPPEALARAEAERQSLIVQFPKGWGRPTKKQRRQLDELL